MQTPAESGDGSGSITRSTIRATTPVLRVRHRYVKHGGTRKCRFNVPTCPGCPDAREEPQERELAEHRLRFIQSLGGTYLPSTFVRSPRVYREQTVVKFIESFFPSGTARRDVLALKLLQWVGPRNAAMTAATDALILIQMGVSSQDGRLTMEGRSGYGVAVQLLNAEIQRQGQAAALNDGLLGAVDISGICELYTNISCDGNGWRNHARGLCALLRARDPTTLNTPWLKALVQSFRQIAFMDALQTRKACLFGEPQWVYTARQMFTGSMTDLATIAMRIPVALQRADALRRTRVGTPDIVDVLSELVDSERDLVEWKLRLYRASDPDAAPSRTVSMQRYENFADCLGGVADAFPMALEYDSFMAAFAHNYYWTCLLLLREAMLDVSRLTREPLLCGHDQEAHLTAAVNECANSISQSFPPLLERHANSIGGVLAVSGPLHFTTRWYARQGESRKLAWCRALEAHLNENMLNVSPKQRNALVARIFARWMAFTN